MWECPRRWASEPRAPYLSISYLLGPSPFLTCDFSIAVRATSQGGDLMSDLNKLVMRRKGRSLPHSLSPEAGEVVPYCLSLIISPSQVSPEKDLALEPVKGQVEPSPKCQIRFHLCHLRSIRQETRTRMTGSLSGLWSSSHT